MWHNRAVLTSTYGFGRKVQKWNQLDANLKSFAHMAVAALVGCSRCLDLNYFGAHNEGLDEVKASEVPRWRESPVFKALERDVMTDRCAIERGDPSMWTRHPPTGLKSAKKSRAFLPFCSATRTTAGPGRAAWIATRAAIPLDQSCNPFVKPNAIAIIMAATGPTAVN